MDVAPKKSLGQHWLVSEPHVRKIVDAVGDVACVLEIGSGKGILTGPLSGRARVVAIEIDPRMAEATRRAAPNVDILQEDILQTDLRAILAGLERPTAVVSNLPYYITAAVVSALCEVSDAFDVAVLMMQEEVAQKLMAPAGDARRGSLSVAVQRHFDIESVTNVPPEAFKPPPKVQSRVLRLVSRGLSQDRSLEKFVRRGFQQPRKTLANNLGDRGLVGRAGLSPSIRPHQVREEEWVLLSELARSPTN